MMKRAKVVGIIISTFLLLTPFMASSAGAADVVRDGSFANGLAEWVINPEIDPTWDPLSNEAVNLHPPSSFMGTVIHQNLNVTDIAEKAFTFSMNLLKNYASYGNTIEVVLTYVDTAGSVHEVDLVNPANADISDVTGSPSVVTANHTFPANARKLVKIEIVKDDYGDFTADNISLTTTASVVVGQIPAVTGLSASAGGYGTSVTITGSNFASTGFVSIGGFSEGVTIDSWSETSITATVGEPARSGRVYVIADYVESSPDFSFNVTSPHFTVDIIDDDLTVIKGQTAEFVVAVDFKNGFTTTGGITFTLTDLSGASFSNLGFTPVPIMNQGGVLLKIDTSGLTGMYPLLVNAFKDGSAYCSVPFLLEVVTVSDIKFYEYDVDYNRVYFGGSGKSVTTQGQVSINYEALDNYGDELSLESTLITLTSPDSTKLAVYANDWGGYDVYAIDSGSATLTATAPDGFQKMLTVNITIPESPRVTLATIDGLSSLTITNTDTGTHVFSATGTEGLGYGTSGSIYLLTDAVNTSPDGKTITREFTVDVDNEYASLGTTFFYAFTTDSTDSNHNYTSRRVVPFTITNDSTYSAISGAVKVVDPALSPYAAEHFILEFYNTDGTSNFSREFHSYHGGGEFTGGAITPGTYKIRCTGGEYGEFQPQWYPNASDIASAESVAFSAGVETKNIYFFLRPKTQLLGDVNDDGNVNLADAIMVLKIMAGIDPTGVELGADVDGDNKIGLAEVIHILQDVAGLR